MWNKSLANELTEIYTEHSDKIPYIIKYEFKRLIDLLDRSEIYGAMLQIKDFAEVILKFPLLVVSSRIQNKENLNKTENAFLRGLLSKLYLGHWVGLARKISKLDYPESKLISMTVKMFETELITRYKRFEIVKWRNTTIGHGALRLETDKSLIEEIECISIHLAESLESMISEYEKLKLYIDIDGEEFIIDENILNKEIDYKNKIYIKSGKDKITVYPYILMLEGNVYFYDSFLYFKHNKAVFIDYVRGYSYQKILDILVDLYENLKIKTNKKNDVIPSEILDVYKKVTRPDKYERPDFLSEWLKAQLDKNEKGIFLLKMERDTGKTSFSKALDGLKPIEKSFTKEEFLEDFRCRTYNIESSIFFEEKHFLSGLYNVLTSNNDNTNIQNGIVGLNPFENKKSEMIRLLDEVRDAAELNYSEEKLLLVIDGLDEVPSDTLDSNFRNIFSYIPKSEDLPEGVFILLTSRRYIEIENGNLKSSIMNIERNADSVLEIDRNNNLYKKLLLSYVSKVTKRLNIKTKENILKYGEYRFGYIKLFTTLVKGNRQFDFKNINENIIVFLLNKLKNTAGNKYVNRAKNMMIVLGYFKIALSAEELAELQNETLSLNFLALIHDLDGILKKIRTGIGTLYALSHEDMRNLIQDIYFENNNFLISNWANELIQLKKNIDGKTDITRLILLSRCFDILNYKNKNILNREVTKNIFNILISEYNEDRIFEMRSLKLILSAHYQLLKMKDYLTEDEIQDTYISISKIYLKIGFYEKSESVINRACNMLLTQGKKYSKKHLMMLDLLARIYYKRSYYEQSKTMYEEIIKNKIKIYGKDDIETVRSKFKYAVLGQDFLLDDGLDKSKKLYKEVLTIQKEKLGIKNSETSWTMNNLADIYWKQGKVDKAQELFIEALENRKEMLGDNHPDVAWIMNFVAGTYYDKTMIIEAKKYYKNTLNIRKSNLGSNHPDYAWTLNDYGKILITNKKLDTAKSVYINSNKIFSTRIGKLHPYTATVLNNLGHLYFEMSEFDLADKYFKDAIIAKETQLKYTNPFLANTYNNYACFLMYKKEFEKAYDYLIKSINIYDKALGEFSLDKAVALTNLAVMYLIKDDKIKVKEIIDSIDEILNAFEYNVLEYIKLSDVYNEIINFMNMSGIKKELNLNINENVDLKMIPVTSFNNSSEIIHILDLDILKNK